MKPLVKRLYASVLSLLLAVTDLSKGVEALTESQLKVALLYKFAQFTVWPALPDEAFDFCILGENRFGEDLDALAGKKLHDKPLKITYPATPEAARGCQLAYLNFPDSKQLAHWIDILASAPVLTVSESPDAWRKGVMVVFEVEPNGVSFSINLTAARDANLSLSAQMLKLAKDVR